LDQPLHWKRPRRIFVNSMSDLFHDAVPDEFIDQVFAVMALSPHHVFQVLTKRPTRMLGYITSPFRSNAVLGAMKIVAPSRGVWCWPTWKDAMHSVWLGVSVEDQKTADERIPLLLQTPASVRFVSYEPALGPVNFREWLPVTTSGGVEMETWLNWIICGGESGPHARPMHPDWARSTREQCFAAGVPFFFKQWGEWLPAGRFKSIRSGDEWFDGQAPVCRNLGDIRGYETLIDDFTWLTERVGKKAAGRLLDGREWNEFPQADRRATASGQPATMEVE